MIDNWKTDIEFVIDEIYFDDTPDKNNFKIMPVELKEAIKNIQRIPIEERTFKG